MNRHLGCLWLVVLCACHHPAGKDYFGTAVAPPGILAQIRPGMTLDQLRAIAPDLKNDPGHGLLLATPASNVKLYAQMDDQVVAYTYVDLEGANGMELLTAAWGPPDAEKDREDRDDVAWRSTATGWRASVFCGHGTAETPLPPFCTIHFRPHKPIEAMFGKAIVPAAELAKVEPRMPVAALKAATSLPFDKDEQTSIRTLDYDGAVEHVSVIHGRLYEIDYRLPIAARAAIDKAWGPVTVESNGQAIWFDAHTGWSAVATVDEHDKTHMQLELIGYMPFDQTIDLLVALGGFKSVAEARAAHPELEWHDDNGKQPQFYLPCNELTDPDQRFLEMTSIGLYASHDSLRLMMSWLDPKKEADVVANLTKRWGPPKQETRADVVDYRWAGHGMVERMGDSLEITIGTGEL